MRPDPLISVDDVHAILLPAITPLPPANIPLVDARGLPLAAPVIAPISLPSFANAAMDGYAVRADDTHAAMPTVSVGLPVSGQIAAGDPPGVTLRPGTAVRIMTGAPLPAGADAVIPFEEIADSQVGTPGTRGEMVEIARPVHPGDNVRQSGEDVRAGAPIFAVGHRLRPADIGLLAALGVDQVSAFSRPRVAILSTGSELSAPGTTLRPGQIHDANGPLLASLVAEAGAVPTPLGAVPDTSDAILGRLQSAPPVDLILVSGGISAGDFDLVKHVLRKHGQLTTWQVRMRPGKPLAFGAFGEVPLIGLPGNPAAAAVSFEIFVRPVLARLASNPSLLPLTVPVTLSGHIANPRGLRYFARATVALGSTGQLMALPSPDQNTSHLSALTAANALVIVPESVSHAPTGAHLTATLLETDPARMAALLGGDPGATSVNSGDETQ